MKEEIIANLSEEQRLEIQNRTLHLGIFTEPYLQKMLAGQKTIESRFSKNRILPYDAITKDDVVFVKKSGGDIVAYFTIREVKFFELDEKTLATIKNRYGRPLCVGDDFFERKRDSRYATLIFIDKLVKLPGFPIHKKGMQTWIKL